MLEHDDAVNLVCTPETDYYLTGVPLDVLQQTLIQPVRDICDRGGKSWRSYGALAWYVIIHNSATLTIVHVTLRTSPSSYHICCFVCVM